MADVIFKINLQYLKKGDQVPPPPKKKKKKNRGEGEGGILGFLFQFKGPERVVMFVSLLGQHHVFPNAEPKQ